MEQGNKGIYKKNLDTMNFLAEKLGNPQEAFKSIHIAGSKGKGSISTMLACILQEAGFIAGLYTSPHIDSFFERISRSGNLFEQNIYENCANILFSKYQEISPNEFPNGNLPSWFEMVTLYSFLCFKYAHCEYVVFETGLGGRLDATNILKPIFCVITPIEYEHTEILGNTLEKIATEKAGIFKEKTPIICTKQRKVVLSSLKKKAAEKNCDFFYVPDYMQVKKINLQKKMMQAQIFIKNFASKNGLMQNLRFSKEKQQYLFISMQILGKIQAENAASACFAALTQFSVIDKNIIARALSKLKIAGRFEIIDVKNKDASASIIFDGAHTKNSLCSTLQTYQKIYAEKRFLLFACAGDKKIAELAPLFFTQSSFDQIFITIPGTFKKSNFAEVSQSFSSLIKNHVVPFFASADFSTIIRQAILQALQNNALLLITGSFYLIAEAKQILHQMESHNELEVL